MPIAIHAVTPEEFTTWVAQAKTKFSASAQPSAQRVDLAQAHEGDLR
jgi:heme/copper-type cytochrome/quinol oxidase subunit 2